MDIEDFAARQSGVVSRQQALAAGLTPAAITWRLASRRWTSLGSGLYLTHTGDVSWEARAAAAVLGRSGPAALAYRSAAHHYGLVPMPDRIELLVPWGATTGSGRQVRVRSTSRFEERVVETPFPPRTTVEHTVLDLTYTMGAAAAIGLAAKAAQRGLTTAEALAEALRGRHRHRGRLLFEAAFGDIKHGAESLLEIRYVQRVERPHRLPTSVLQAPGGTPQGRLRRDFSFAEWKVIIEVDGRLGHEGDGMQRDRRRDRAAAVDGWVTLRYMWWEIIDDPCAVAAEIAQVLRGRGWTGTLTPCCEVCVAVRAA
ncbi:MAG TPA: type IV toxin-antitoxin system AbiEi family antitoxin domain-containing protein [Intrasporangium sp.]|uniref:type IV toxin-antitoxin system AbiEi family antitoxin domain-containing protein n=1 Tax=Intrasporangium sp. TaxID=1925024 RepID=UPI002D76DCF6|nr:type IV toxin-antitoxin system AbiEi family antitoxin domain-containing protein [Intrasporangium sp.]HET7397040.1 type IV toxin-antitoxin system AbiEi family antitoxin domain-containing protein [Intrasporangium sp.]